MRALIFSGWDVLRLLRLALGIFCLGDALVQKNLLTGVIGTVLLYQALFNTGCCGSGGCAINTNDAAPGSQPEQTLKREEISSK